MIELKKPQDERPRYYILRLCHSSVAHIAPSNFHTMKLVQIVYLTILSAASATASVTAATPVMAAPPPGVSIDCPDQLSGCTSTPHSNCENGTVDYYVAWKRCWDCCFIDPATQ
ncbi:hypothetical protein BDR07DRAFT_1421447 [Suillus spraguei]|nr:hypothetical protein BDR07DRAFT_1421447 [Suillus spraguei]